MTFSIPMTTSAEEDVEWTEHVSVFGSCSTQNTRRHIQVNKTVVEIVVNLTWETNGTGANLDMWMEHFEGYVVNASDSYEMPEIMRISEFPNRGRWTLVVIPISCGSSGEAHFTANVTLRNIKLPRLEISETEIELGESVLLTVSSEFQNMTDYFFDYGNGKDSGWTQESSISIEYENSGEYSPRAKIRYSDGTESDWVEFGSVNVYHEIKEMDMLLMAQFTLVILILITILVFMIIKKRKGA